ncbi:MAG TPA: reverse transcriptase family protein, partial [Candidatus Babeliaceae bacterium]|nr:reverse transcriptase family protein [Candidatus Babeliaceae bacterium]
MLSTEDEELLVKSSNTSTALPLPAAPSVLVKGKKNVMCNMTQEKIVIKYHLTELDACPLCQIAIGYHTSNPSDTGIYTSSGSSDKGGKDGSKSILPVWKKDYKQVKPLLDRIEQILIADGVDKKYWPRCLVKVVVNPSDGNWILRNILDTKVTWEEARKLFADHFERFDYPDKLIGDYEYIKQNNDENAQEYSDRYSGLVDELGYDRDNPLVIQHYINSLKPETLAEFKQHVSRAKILNKEVKLTSLKQVINIVLELERVRIVYNENSSSHNKHNNNNKNGGIVRKVCKYHPGATSHTTQECQSKGQKSYSNHYGSKSPSSLSWKSNNSSAHTDDSKRAEKKEIICYNCNGIGHRSFDPICPKRSGMALRESNKSNPSSISISTSTNVKPGMTSSSMVSSTSSSTRIPSSAATGRIQSIHSDKNYVEIDRDNIKQDSKDDRPSSVVGSMQSVVNPSSTLDRALCEQVCMPRKLDVMIMLKGMIFNTLVDTGAEISCIDEELVKELKLPVGLSKFKSFIMAHSGVTVSSIGSVFVDVTVLFPSYKRETISTQFLFEVLPVHSDTADHHFILGRDLILKVFPNGIPPEYISLSRTTSNVGIISSLVASCPSDVMDVSLQSSSLTTSTSVELETEYTAKREQLLSDLAPLLTINASITGFCNLPEAVMELKINPDMESKLWRRQYPIPQTLMAMTTAVIDRWYRERKTCLAPPGCRYNNPITPVPKRDDQGALTAVRPCLDVRALNKALVISDNFPIPQIRSALEALAGNSIFSELDLQEAYLQLPLHPDSRPYTAFTWNNQQYMFVGCPFGLSPLTSHFQRLMSRIFSDMPFCYPYVDNLPFASKDWETHLQYATMIITRLNSVNLRIKPKFTTIGHSQLKCLGHIISSRGISIDPEKLQAVKDWPLPKTGTELQSFLGLCSFLRQHVRHFA